MKIGFVSFASPGHLNPSVALAAGLVSRGHDVIFYTLSDGVEKIEQHGFTARPYGVEEITPETISKSHRELGALSGQRAVKFTVELMRRCAVIGLRDLPALFSHDQIDGLAVDQVVADAAVVARASSIPFVTVCNAMPIYVDPAIPPVFSHLAPARGMLARLRNRGLNRLVHHLSKPVISTINEFQRDRQLPLYRSGSQIRSHLALITQVPEAFDFPRAKLPDIFHYTGPFHSERTRSNVDFPWDRIDDCRPLIYASMGTLQNQIRHVFHVIAEACQPLSVQLVISLGGSADPAEFSDLPGDPLVVRYVPQLELLKRATLCITHAGLNTALESLKQGVPMLAIPVTNDQPGVAARIQWHEVGRRLRLKKINVQSLRAMIQDLLSQSRYTEKAKAIQHEIAGIDGIALASEIIERAIKTGKPVPRAS